jgi:transcription elongation factor Elf1
MLTIDERKALNIRMNNGENIRIAIHFPTSVKMGFLLACSLDNDTYFAKIKNDSFKLYETVNPLEILNGISLDENDTNTKNNNEMGNLPMLEKTLKNGVEVYSLEVENNFREAQNILDLGETTTANIDAENAYNHRVSNDFVATYKVKIERNEDYQRFTDMIRDAKRHNINEKRKHLNNARDILRSYYDDAVNQEDKDFALYQWKLLDNWFHSDNNTCDCSICSFRIPTIEEWKANKYQIDEKRTMKLGKALGKAKFNQSIIDFYSLQTKTEKELYFTVSDLVQHIAGMSYYAEEDSWDGYNGTSCQNPKYDTDMAMSLGGSLWDNKLFVGMLHESLEDLEDMTDKLIARTILRLIHIDKKPCLIATTYYGNNDTKDMLHNALNQLNEVDIYSKDIRNGYDREYIEESANGWYNMPIVKDIHIRETIECEVEVECPHCEGDGETSVYVDEAGEHVNIECPCCGGSGETYAMVYNEIDEWREVEIDRKLSPYDEGYSHDENMISIRIDTKELRRIRSEYANV